MICRRCKGENPSTNKFCGMCGVQLESASPAADKGSSTTVAEEAPPFVGAETRAAQPATHRSRGKSIVSNSSGDRGISGPSFLGLSYEPEDQPFHAVGEEYSSSHYLLEEKPERSVSWRAYALFILLLAVAGLLYSQWKAAHDRQSSGKSDVATVLERNAVNEQTKNSPSVEAQKIEPTAKPGDAVSPEKKNSESEVGSANRDQAKDADSGEKPGPDQDKASAKQDESMSDNAETEKASPRQKSTKSKTRSKPQSAPTEENSDEVASQRQSEKLYANDPLLIKAQQYLQGKNGSGQNCQQGLVYLRSAIAKSNPKAMVQMGALYMSGKCVTQDPVAAYNWLSEAQSFDPYNPWIAKSKTALYASMTDSERQKIR